MPFGWMAVTQEPSRIMATLQSVLPMQRTSRLDADEGDAMEAPPMQEAEAACRTFRCAPLRTTETGASDGYQKQPGGARRTSKFVRMAAGCDRMFRLEGRDESRPGLV